MLSIRNLEKTLSPDKDPSSATEQGKKRKSKIQTYETMKLFAKKWSKNF